MNRRTLLSLLAIVGYSVDALLTFTYVNILHWYGDVHSINYTVFGLFIPHFGWMLLGAIQLQALSRQPSKIFYTYLAFLAALFWYPVIFNTLTLGWI